MISSLDKELSHILKPLAKMNAALRVSQFPNTLCLGYHYLLAHGANDIPPDRIGVPTGRISLADWNHPEETLHRDKKYFNNVYLLYLTQSYATTVCGGKMSDGSFYSSVAVTRFRPRFAFLAATGTATDLVTRMDGKWGEELFNEAAIRRLKVNIRTDVIEQAKTVVAKSIPKTSGPEVRYVGAGWPEGVGTDDDQITVLYYGAPGTAYMRGNPDVFFPLEIPDDLVLQTPAFETHAVWYTPKGRSDATGIVRSCLQQYHSLLFENASKPNASGGFAAMRVACNELLGNQHPSYPHSVLPSPDAFRTLLNDHHSAP